MRTRKMEYLISMCGDAPVLVTGYAIDSGLPAMICVRRTGVDLWQAEEFLTGLRFGGYFCTKKDAIRSGIDYAKWKLETGEWQSAIKKFCKRKAP